jgi:hypothetical protein
MYAAFAIIPISHESFAIGSAIRQALTPEGMFNMPEVRPNDFCVELLSRLTAELRPAFEYPFYSRPLNRIGEDGVCGDAKLTRLDGQRLGEADKTHLVVASGFGSGI